jgi:hypothetical protein
MEKITLTFRLLCVIALLIIFPLRLPAPIQEGPESPTPAPEQSAKPKPKRTIRPKVTTENSESSTGSTAPSTQKEHAGTPKIEVSLAKDEDSKPAKVFPADIPKVYAFFKTKGTKREISCAGFGSRKMWAMLLRKRRRSTKRR